jgi:hypothetical protein
VERGRGAAAGNLFERPQRAAATTAVAGKPARRGASGGGRGRPEPPSTDDVIAVYNLLRHVYGRQ